MEKLRKLILRGAAPCLALTLALAPSVSHADPGYQYCITPAFVAGNIPPNLMLLIDNSASMYDLFYQDTANKYCANSPTTACTSNTTCAALPATCWSSGTTTTVTTTSAKPCASNSDCPVSNKCTAGFCRYNQNNLSNSDYVSTSQTQFTPKSCTSNSDCGSGDTCNNTCSVTRQCYDTSYDNSQTYTGYFVSSAVYSYDSTNGKLVGGATMPGTCTYAPTTTKYVCVNTTGTGTNETLVTDSTGFVATGNFLNWLSASKFDIEKEILTGGKYDTTAQTLVAESRGCAGREFVKSVPALSNITFAVRGGSPGGISKTQSQATEYGQTYIDIHTGAYNANACLSAMDDWMQVTSTNPPNLGGFQNDTKGCVGTSTTFADTNVTASSVWNHILHDCYQGMTGGAQSYSTNLPALLLECQNIYASLTPDRMTDPNAGYAVCSSALSYNLNNTSWTGYLGSCWNSTAQNFSNCTQAQQIQRMSNYCNVNVTTNPVIDPSSTSLSTVNQSVPGFIMQLGLLNTQPVGTIKVQVAQASEPTGLIYGYRDRIRFGVETFQNNGSGSECGSYGIPCSKVCSTTTTRICYVDNDCPTGETCGPDPLPKRDGGKVVAYVGAGYCSVSTGTACTVDSDCASLSPSNQYCKPSIGNNSSGMIKAINDIPATSWTPFAESFYNAIGYFARTNTYSETPPTSRSDANFSNLPSPNTEASYYTSKNPSQYRCQSNNVLLITDGMSTADRSTASENFASLYASQTPSGMSGYDSTNSCPSYGGSRSLSTLAWVAQHRGIKTMNATGTASTTAPVDASEKITTYVVYSGPDTTGQPGECDPKTLMTDTAANGGTTLLSASNPADLYNQINAALSAVAAKAASGTAASILSNSEGSGANILQAVFYPRKVFENQTEADWIGEMQNLWYFVDPQLNRSTIREDTDHNDIFDLIQDYVVTFRFDSSDNTTYAYVAQDTNGDGAADTAEVKESADAVNSIWRAGKQLWARPLTGTGARPRNLKTTIDDASLIDFSSSTFTGSGGIDNSATLAPYLNVADSATATTLINWVHGLDQSGYRSRTVSIKDPSTNVISSGVWRLGDIISSTPRIQSSLKLNTYNLQAPSGYSDSSYDSYVNSNDYKKHGMVYVGANDGMLHAFNFGKLDVTASGTQKATLQKIVSTDPALGEEMWAFIPKQALPYLKYSTDVNYSHLYYVDGSTVLFDASIGAPSAVAGCTAAGYYDCDKLNSVVDSSNALVSSKNPWRSILIGGMGLGGASSASCTDPSTNNCVQTPRTDPANSATGLGFSSYFALDVSDPKNPSLMWEFKNDNLGFATTGPAIVRVGQKGKNGRWFAIFGSGPTGPIDTDGNQFQGRSNQNLRFFVVDLKTGTLVRTIDTGITEAFAGSMVGGSIDTDRWNAFTNGNYQDDAVLVGYTKKGSGTPATWTDGGVLRIVTKESTDPADWVVSPVVQGVGPVVTAIARLQDRKNKNLWYYFGTGRYYYRAGSSIDDYSSQRSIYGIKDPCYNTAAAPGNQYDKNCSATISSSDITDQSTSISTTIGTGGWKIDLDGSTTSFGAERVVSDAVALTNGTVFVTTFEPTSDACGFGGNSFLWALGYNTGDRPPDAALSGKALIQLSTGEFKEVDLSQAFGTGASRLLRRSSTPMTGKPPADAFPVVSKSANKPVKKILHIQER